MEVTATSKQSTSKFYQVQLLYLMDHAEISMSKKRGNIGLTWEGDLDAQSYFDQCLVGLNI